MDASRVQDRPAPTPKRTRQKLQVGGQALLEDYMEKHPSLSSLPPLNDRRDLLKRVQQMPGCEWYEKYNMDAWFKRQVEKNQATKPATSRTGEDQIRSQLVGNERFPSLTQPALDHLRVLIRDLPNPGPATVKIWASLLASTNNTNPEDVVAWVAYVQELIHIQQGSSAPTSLPTPSDTVTPEPSTSILPQLPPEALRISIDFHDLKRDPMLSPIISPLAEQLYVDHHMKRELPALPTPQSSVSPVIPFTTKKNSTSSSTIVSPVISRPYYRDMEPPTPQSAVSSSMSYIATPSPDTFNRRDSQTTEVRTPATIQAIIEGVREAFSNHGMLHSMTPVPTNTAEFEVMFAPYEKKLAHLMHTLES